MRIAGVDVPEPLLNALRDGELVVFAGAGVSMGPPAGLPDFGRLADQVAEGRFLTKGADEPEDRFLDRLAESGLDVHQRAATALQQDRPEPTALHHNILRLHARPENVRVVTTNFDLLFEQAAASEFNPEPRAYYAPALPLGSRFQGLVHIHGSVDEPEEMILTSQDFGRAYLTQSDGWARRFLVELFGNCVVLFVGYSHSDTIMTYLTPSLPRTDKERRFALVGVLEEGRGYWDGMGITPIMFPQEYPGDFSGLDGFMAGLSLHMRRGILDWQRDITAIAGGLPPIDEETAGIIEHAFATPEHTRFFVETASSPEWIDWLDRRNFLSALFSEGILTEKEVMLSHWLAHRFAVEHPGELLSTIERHDGRVNADLWVGLAVRLGRGEEDLLDRQTLSRWVHFLWGAIPPYVDETFLSAIGKTCARLGALDNLLQVFDALTASRFQVRPDARFSASEHRAYGIRALWDECLRPNLLEIGLSLLERVGIRLLERRSLMEAWGEVNGDWDPDSYSRPAIELDSDNHMDGEIDVFVDIARDCLESLAGTNPSVVGMWSERFVRSGAPLLRRLAVHAMSARDDLTAGEKLKWLLDHCDVNDVPAHEEISRASVLAYPDANSEYRTLLAQAILKYRPPQWANFSRDPEVTIAHYRLRWFRRLHEADPKCSIAQKAFGDVLECHPELAAVEGRSAPVNVPWTAEQVLKGPASEWLTRLMEYQPPEQERFDGNDRRTMLEAFGAAVGINPGWGLDLADVMAAQGIWETDLWHHVLTSWDPEKLNEDELVRLLQHLSAEELHGANARDIPRLLQMLVRRGDGLIGTVFRCRADAVAKALGPYAAQFEVPSGVGSVGGVPRDMGWLFRATNHLSGQLALYWIFSIELWRTQQELPPQSLNDRYKGALDAICGDDGVTGKLGRTILASQFHFLFVVDEEWTLNNLLPLFDVEHEDFHCAWDGFLTWGHMSHAIAEHLREAFLRACRRINEDFGEAGRRRFLEYYLGAMELFIDGADDKWVTELFKYADAETKHLFASGIGHRLRGLDESRQQEWWNVWLRDYWDNRVEGIPSSLDEEEIARMLEWVLRLDGVFREAVEVANRMPPKPIKRSRMLHRLEEKSLVDSYPEEMAKFLLHLGQCEVEPWFWHGTKGVVDRLRETGLSEDLDQALLELEALHFLGP